jgi:hypothetical protein
MPAKFCNKSLAHGLGAGDRVMVEDQRQPVDPMFLRKVCVSYAPRSTLPRLCCSLKKMPLFLARKAAFFLAFEP